eukprot:307634-Prorocentrum_minimum.AAC.1
MLARKLCAAGGGLRQNNMWAIGYLTGSRCGGHVGHRVPDGGADGRGAPVRGGQRHRPADAHPEGAGGAH